MKLKDWRPIEITQNPSSIYEKLVLDLLYSNPIEFDENEENKTKEQGFEITNEDTVISVFSCMNYAKEINAGAILTIKKNFEIIPKILYPASNLYNQWEHRNKEFETFLSENSKNPNVNILFRIILAI